MQTDFLARYSIRTLAFAAMTLPFLSIASSAQQQPIVRLSPLPGIQDFERPESLISASQWLRGLYLDLEPGGRRPRLVGVIPQAWRGTTICVRAITIDGRYEFSADYSIPADWSEGDAEFEYRTAFDIAWSAATPADSGVAISSGSCTAPETASTTFIPAVWNSVPADDDGDVDLIVHLHARGANEVVATAMLGADKFDVECIKIDRTDAEQFNFTCRIALPKNTTGQIDFQYIRLNNGRATEPRSAVFLLAGAP